MYLNALNIIGRLVADPEYKKGSKEDGSNDRVWSRIAVNRPGSEDADFVPFVCWGATARAVAQHCAKGKVLILTGQLRTKSTKRPDGSYDNYFECNCSAVYFGPDAKGKGAPEHAEAAPQESAPATPAMPDLSDPAVAQQLLGMLAAAGAKAPAAEAPAADPFAKQRDGADEIPV